MISFEESLEHIFRHSKVGSVQTKDLALAQNHVLAEDLICPFDLPRFNSSSVDGYGVKLEDLEGASADNPVTLAIQDEIQAGSKNQDPLKAKHSLAIMTGAPVPHGVEAVVMKEYCHLESNKVLIKKTAKQGENIRYKGEESKSGQTILSEGNLLNPAAIGLAATLGFDKVAVYKKPKVCLLITGNELVQPGNVLAPGQIYDANSYSMSQALISIGLEAPIVLYAQDNKEETKKKLEEALKSADLIVSTGGVSVGDYDYIKTAAEELGTETIFWRIALKPGKPVYFGKYSKGEKSSPKIIFGLPGNPVSCLVTLHQLVLPAIRLMCGLKSKASIKHKARLSNTIKKQAGRMEFVRGIYSIDDQGAIQVSPTTGQESHMLSGLAKANCLIHFPLEASEISAGNSVTIEIIHWSL
jgi:molybdopterin molybdotransferase